MDAADQIFAVVDNFHRDRDYERANERGEAGRARACSSLVASSIVGRRTGVVSRTLLLIFAIVRRPPIPMNVKLQAEAFRHKLRRGTFLQGLTWNEIEHLLELLPQSLEEGQD